LSENATNIPVPFSRS